MAQVYCNISPPLSISNDVFNGSYTNYTTLYVPSASISEYKSASVWKSFGKILPIEGNEPDNPENPNPAQCSKPEFFYSKGKLTVISETESAKCITSIEDSDIRIFDESDINLSVTYKISSYAVKDGYLNSETAYATLCWIDEDPVKEGMSTEVSEIPSRALLITNNEGLLKVSGLTDEIGVSVYSISGELLGTSKSIYGTAYISTNASKNNIVIIKIADKSVKVLLK